MAIPYSRYVIGPIPWYSALIVLGVLLAYLIGAHEEKRLGLPSDTMIDIALIAVPCGIIGSRLYYVIMEWPQFAGDLLSILYVWEGGVAIYGAVIGGGIGAALYCRKKKIRLPKVLDMVAPGLLLAQAIGRWGNYFNMEAFGLAVQNPAFQFFPLSVKIWDGSTHVWHMATFFYESVWNACGFLALMGLRKRQKRVGDLFLWYLLIYGSGRFVIEQLRVDSLLLGGLRVSQGVSFLLCAVAAGMLIWRGTSKHGSYLSIAFFAIFLALARWFVLSTGWYIALLVMLTILVLIVLIAGFIAHGFTKNTLPYNLKTHSFWIVFPLLVDALGLYLTQSRFITPGLGFLLHSMLCSLSLPCYVFWFWQRLSGLPKEPVKGETECPQEP